MSIWGHRDSERPAGEDHQTGPRAGEHEGPAPSEPDYRAEAEGGQPAPAFLRAQGGAPAPFGRPPAYGYVPAEPAAQTQAPEPGRDDDIVVLDSETEVKDPALTGTAPEPAAAGPARDAEAGHGVVTASDTEAAREREAADGAEAAHGAEAHDGEAGRDAEAGHGVVTASDTEAAREREAADGLETPHDADAHAGEAASGPAGTQVPGVPPVIPVPPAAGAVPAAVPAPAAPDADSASPGGISAQRWHEILAMFVDDPRGSVTMAADAVNSAIDEFLSSVRARQRTLASSWQGSDTGTEQLRTALRDYRRFWQQMRQMTPAQEEVPLDGNVKPG